MIPRLTFAEHVFRALKAEAWIAWRDREFARGASTGSKSRKYRRGPCRKCGAETDKTHRALCPKCRVTPKRGPCSSCGVDTDQTYRTRCPKCRHQYEKAKGWEK